MEDVALIAALVTMLALAVVQIFLRDFFDQGIFWAESFLRILVLWVAMLGAMVATRHRNHISIDVVSRYLPERPARAAALITSLVSAAICGVVSWYAVEFVRFEYEDQTIAFAHVPSWMCETILPFGFAVMSLRFLSGGLQRLFMVD
jgi:TRAP-type C4-dicarboxylate transport system permease small subunit